MPHLLALLPNPPFRTRLLEAAGFAEQGGLRLRVSFACDWTELHLIARSEAADLAVVDPYRGSAFEFDQLARFNTDFPTIGLLPYADFPPNSAQDVLRMATLRIQRVVTFGHGDSVIGLHAAITAAVRGFVAGAVLKELTGLLPHGLRPTIRYLLENSHRRLTPGEVAKVHFCHPKTLREQLKRLGLPPVGKLIVWMRLLNAAYLLQGSSRSVEAVAGVLDFPSGSALRNQLQRYTGATPKDLARAPEGGLQIVLRAFTERYSFGAWSLL